MMVGALRLPLVMRGMMLASTTRRPSTPITLASGVTTLAGVIDPGYRGELKVVMTNLSTEAQTVAPGHRIAQLRIVERIQANFEETDILEDTERGEGGFGSTGR